MQPISVFLIVLNEEVRLSRTLKALDWVDEIIVIDSGSTDRTVEIAEALGADVHHLDWEGYGPQKVYAEGLCRNDWVLNVDADEIITPELAREISRLDGSKPGVYRIRILNVYPGDDRPRPLANDYNVVRLYHRSVAGYRDHPLFDRVETVVPVEQLIAPIHHFPLISWEHFIEKENRYSSFVAKTAGRRSRWKLLIRLPFEMPMSFFKFYFLRRHFTGGWKGFAFAIGAAAMRTIRIAKMLESYQQKK